MTEEQKKDGGFYLKTGVVTAAFVVVIFFIKIWIIDALRAEGKPVPSPRQETYSQEAPKNWDKTKVKIDWKEAVKHIGSYVETEGTVVASHRTEKICYLNFDKNYRENVALVIFAGSFARFPKDPEKYYLGKKIKVEGRVEEYKGRPEIKLGSQDQVKIITNE